MIGVTGLLHAVVEDAKCRRSPLEHALASNARMVREADRMFKLSPERRVHRLKRAKTALLALTSVLVSRPS
jgi:hypothetical protein